VEEKLHPYFSNKIKFYNMAKKAKKKAVAKMSEVIPPYATLTEQQFDELRDLVIWDNPQSELESIVTEQTVNEILYKLGRVSVSFDTMIKKLDSILDAIAPESTNEFTDSVDWDDAEDDYEDTNED
jgi:hypothetical protein